MVVAVSQFMMSKVFLYSRDVTQRLAHTKRNFAVAHFINTAVILELLVNKAAVPEIRHLSEAVVYSLMPYTCLQGKLRPAVGISPINIKRLNIACKMRRYPLAHLRDLFISHIILE